MVGRRRHRSAVPSLDRAVIAAGAAGWGASPAVPDTPARTAESVAANTPATLARGTFGRMDTSADPARTGSRLTAPRPRPTSRRSSDAMGPRGTRL